MADSIRALYFCSTVTKDASGGEKVVMHTSYDPTIPEEKRFAEASPSGNFDVYIKNPMALGLFVPGKKYYLDITPVPEASA